jgi:hypothetical protein
MRILLLNGNTDATITALIAKRAQEALPRLGLPACDLVPATAPFGARYIATRAAVTIAGHAVLAGLAQHIGTDNPQGFDAAIIACFGEPAIEAARELLPIPVMGMAEASITLALEKAPRIALLTGGAAWVPMLEEFALIRGHGRSAIFGWPTVPELETLRNAWFAAPDLAAERRIAEEIQRHAWQEVPFIPLGLVLPPQAYRRSIRDVVKETQRCSEG